MPNRSLTLTQGYLAAWIAAWTSNQTPAVLVRSSEHPARGPGVKILILQPRSGFYRGEICVRVEVRGRAVEQVPKYSGTVSQVPYNQHLGASYGRG